MIVIKFGDFAKESGKEHIKNTRHKEGVHQVLAHIPIGLPLTIKIFFEKTYP